MIAKKNRNMMVRVLCEAFFILHASFFICSCATEVDDYFDQSASQRLTATMDRARQILRSAENGWEFEYYPGADLAYGGMVYTVRFDSLTATVGCSLIADSTYTSLYRLTNDSGPVLTFDSYNPLLHYFSTPSSGEYEAKGGEFEFVISDMSDSLITLYGKKTHNTMYLRRLNGSPDEYAQSTIGIHDAFVEEFKGAIGNVDVTGVAIERRLFFYCKYDKVVQVPDTLVHLTDTLALSADTIVGLHDSYIKTVGDMKRDTIYTKKDTTIVVSDTTSTAFTFNDRGIRLYQPLWLHGVRMQTFDYDKATFLLTCTDASNGDFVLTGQPRRADRMYFPMYEGEYTLNYGSNSKATVRLVPNRLEGTFLMRGLSEKYDLVVRYDPETGNLKLGAQVVGTFDGNVVYWSTAYYADGSIRNIGTSDEGQFTITWNGRRTYASFAFSPTLPHATYPVNSAVLIYLYYDEAGNLAAALLNDAEWVTNGSYLFANLKSLTRGRID